MHINKRLLILVCAIGMTQSLPADEMPDAVRQHPDAARIIERRSVRLQTGGQAALTFDVASNLIKADDFLGALQTAYAAMLPPGETPEFVVAQTEDGHFSYENRDGEKTAIEELHRQLSPQEARLYLLTKGDRFFGSFEALTAIEVRPRENNAVDWQVQVLAWPHNPFSRFVARTGIVNRYFRSKTDEVSELAVRIGMFLTQQEP